MVNLRENQEKDEKAAGIEKFFILNKKKDTEKDGEQTAR